MIIFFWLCGVVLIAMAISQLFFDDESIVVWVFKVIWEGILAVIRIVIVLVVFCVALVVYILKPPRDGRS